MQPRGAPAQNDFTTPPHDAQRTSSGLAYKVVRAGTGTERPKPLSTVTIHYTGWTGNGRMFDDSVAREQPLTLAVDTVMPGLAEALQLMVVGEQARFWIPEALAYTPPGPPQSALVFDVELLAIQRVGSGQPGTIDVRVNSPDIGYVLVQPDGTPLNGKGPHTFTGAPPGRYRIKPTELRSYAIGLLATPRDMTLASGGTLSITINYKPIVQ